MRILLPLTALLLLTGCAPSTPSDEAWETCVHGPLALWELENPDHSAEELTLEAVRIAEVCDAQFERDPAAFEAAYG